MNRSAQTHRWLGFFALAVLAAACTNGSGSDGPQGEVSAEVAARVESEIAESECQRQFRGLGEALRETAHAIDSAEDDHEEARRAFVASDNQDDAERGLVALNNQSFRLAGLYAALAADASMANTSEFYEVADRFASAAREMSVAYADAASSGSPERIIATRPVMEAAWRALGLACPD